MQSLDGHDRAWQKEVQLGDVGGKDEGSPTVAAELRKEWIEKIVKEEKDTDPALSKQHM